MPLDLSDRLERILFFAGQVAHEISDEETVTLKKSISKLFKVMEKVAECSCDYVKRGRFGGQSACLNFANADDRREDVEWAGPPAKDRRNEQRVDQGH
jgi:hypothetical protein